MIRFKCIYCGQKVLAGDDGAGKRGLCPKCGHNILVSAPTANKPIIGLHKEPSAGRPVSAEKEYVSGRDVGPQEVFGLPAEKITEIYEEKAGFLIPNYDELTLFLTAATFIILYMSNDKMQVDVSWFLARLEVWRRYIYVTLFAAGLIICLYHVFTPRRKTDAEKAIMLLFAVTINAATGVIAGIYMIKESPGWLLVFPVWNIANGVLMILMQYVNLFDTDCIAERDATLGQAFLGLVTIGILFVVCNFILRLHWAITFSICIVYATSFDRALQSVFPGIGYDESEQVS